MFLNRHGCPVRNGEDQRGTRREAWTVQPFRYHTARKARILLDRRVWALRTGWSRRDGQQSLYGTASLAHDHAKIPHLPDSPMPPSPESPPLRGGEKRSYESAYGSQEDLYCTRDRRIPPSPSTGEGRGGGGPAGKQEPCSVSRTRPRGNSVLSCFVRVQVVSRSERMMNLKSSLDCTAFPVHHRPEIQDSAAS